MADKYIEQAPQGEMVSPDGSEVLPLAKNSNSDYWMKVGNLLLQPRYIISPTVAANNLTWTLKNLDGSAPSTTKPLKFRVGDTEYTLTSDPAFTKAAGTNWMNLGSATLAAQNTDLFSYAIGETGAAAGLKFGYSRIPYAATMGDFVNTTTSEKYIAGNWTNFNATDAVVNIGRFRAQLSAAAGHNWSIPSAKVINRPIFETDWLAWTATQTGYSANPTLVTNYKVVSDELHWQISATSVGTSNATTVTVTLPFLAFVESTAEMYSTGRGHDNGVEVSPTHSVSTALGNVMAVYKGPGATAWTNSGNKFHAGEGFYRLR